jgi:hypothetical protein
MMQNPEFNNSKRANDFLNAAANRATETYLDESNLAYEAARLEKFAVVVVVHFPKGMTAEEVKAAVDQGQMTETNIRCVKGDEPLRRYLHHEIDSVEWESVYTTDADNAIALEKLLSKNESSNVISFPRPRI